MWKVLVTSPCFGVLVRSSCTLSCTGCPGGLLFVTALAKLQALPEWARKTLQKHASDPRPHFKTDEQLEKGTTGDAMWDACQHQLVVTGQPLGMPPFCHETRLPVPSTESLRALPTVWSAADRWYEIQRTASPLRTFS